MPDIKNTKKTKNATILNLQNQLDLLVESMPQLQEEDQPVGQLWTDILQEWDYLLSSIQLQEAVSETMTAISEITDTMSEVDNLAVTLASLIQERLEFYYVGIYLVEKNRKQARLCAAAPTNQQPLEGSLVIKIDNKSSIGRAIQTQQVIRTAYNESKPTISHVPNLAENLIELVLPLTSRGDTSGALVILTQKESQTVSPRRQLDILQPLASHIANAIQTVQLFATVDRQLEQMAALYHVSLHVGGQLNVELPLEEYDIDIDTLLDTLAELSLKLSDADVSLIQLIDIEHQEPTVTKFALKNFHTAQTTTIKTYLSEQVAKSKQAILANNWERPQAEDEATAPGKIAAIMNVPIVLRNQAIGTIEVQSFAQFKAFNDSDLHILSLLATQAAIAIENTHLFNRAENNSRFLKTIIEHIPDPIFIKDQDHIWVEMNQANVEVLGRPYSRLIGKTDHDFFPKELADEFRRRDDEVFNKNQSLTFEDKTTWADGQEHIAYTRLIPVPSQAERPEYLLGITHDITERKAKEAEKEKLLTEMAMLYNGSQAIANALSEKQIFDAFFQQIRTQDPDEIIAYYFKVVDGEPLWAELEAHWQGPASRQKGPSDLVSQQIYLPDSTKIEFLTTKSPLFIEDVTTDKNLSELECQNFVANDIYAVAVLPMITTGQAIGVTIACFSRPYSFSTTIKRFWRAMVDQASILLSNRQLIQEVTSRAMQIETAAEVARTASSILDVQQLLNSTVRLIRDRFELYYVGVFLVDDSKEWAVLRAGTGQAGRNQLKEKHRLKISGDSMVGWCLANKKARIAIDVGKDAIHFQNPHLPDTRSEMALPLIHHGEAIGALTVQSTEPVAFTQQDTILLQTMADQLANAIKNALLFEQTQTALIERQQSAEALRNALERTQSLYRISDALATITNPRTTLETVLGEYLHLLGLKRGGILLLDEASGHNRIQALYIDGQPAEPDLVIPVKEDIIAQHLIKHPTPLVIEDTQTHPATKDQSDFLADVGSMLLIPLIVRAKVVGRIGADAPEKGRIFSQDDIEVGKLIADQLSIWLDNRLLLEETQKRSNLLQTAAEVSRSASLILDVNELINKSVNLIRDKFDFYYVGLFLVDAERKWAVLRAGTGEAGRIQLAKNHRLKIGGGSMIGWCVENRQARIALDVGEEAVHFQNPDLPETHSEMALPLISRDEILGALTVQSVERSAFSDEDITLLQTMADQLANAIKNAYLFEEVTQTQEEAEERLQETIALQQLSQALSGTLQIAEVLDLFFRACTKVIGFDYVIFSQVDQRQERIRAIDGVGVSENHIKRANQPLDSPDIMADIIRTGKTEIISGWDDRFNKALYEDEGHSDWLRIFIPITLRGENIGLVEAGFNKKPQAKIDEAQIRLLRVFIDQTILALDNAQRYEASQRLARREALIKEITTKVRASTDIDTILRTAVKEVGQALNSRQTYVNLIPSKHDHHQRDQ